MKSKYTPGVVDNIFTVLNSDQSLKVIGLSLASNDLVSNLKAIGTFPEGENSYFFYSSIAIVREVAKLVVEIGKSTVPQKFSAHTRESFQELQCVLTTFHDTSLVKSVMKPIRDVTFHYDFAQSQKANSWDSTLEKVNEWNELDVGLVPGERSPLGQRYSFADMIRSEYVNQFLTKEIVSKISVVSANVGVFVDSLLNDLVQELKAQRENDGETAL